MNFSTLNINVCYATYRCLLFVLLVSIVNSWLPLRVVDWIFLLFHILIPLPVNGKSQRFGSTSHHWVEIQTKHRQFFRFSSSKQLLLVPVNLNRHVEVCHMMKHQSKFSPYDDVTLKTKKHDVKSILYITLNFRQVIL